MFKNFENWLWKKYGMTAIQYDNLDEEKQSKLYREWGWGDKGWKS